MVNVTASLVSVIYFTYTEYKCKYFIGVFLSVDGIKHNSLNKVAVQEPLFYSYQSLMSEFKHANNH